jgi:hypothetical protein
MNTVIVNGLAAVFLASGVAGCSSQPDDLPEPSSGVTLDEATAQVNLPLDEYGMAKQIDGPASAARLVQVRHCLEQTGIDPGGYGAPEYLGLLALQPPAPDWTFGYWDAQWIVKAGNGIDGHGAYRAEDSPAFPLPEPSALPSSAEPALLGCQDSPKIAWLGRWSADERSAVVSDDSWESLAAARGDPRFGEILDEERQCLTEVGVEATVGEGVLVVSESEKATPEAAKSAVLAYAGCADKLGTVQKLAAITAAYQERFITQHEAELNGVKALSEHLEDEVVAVLEAEGIGR